MSEEAAEHEPTDATRATVRAQAKVNPSKARIAKKLGITTAEFDRHYHEDWETGREEAKTGLMAKMLAQGMAGNPTAAFRYLTLMEMVAPSRVELTGKDGGPIQHVDLTRLSDEELDLYGRLAARAAGLDPSAARLPPPGPITH